MNGNQLIVEFFYHEEPTSIGIISLYNPYIRFILLERDEDTGARSVKDIVEFTNGRDGIRFAYKRLDRWYDEENITDIRLSPNWTDAEGSAEFWIKDNFIPWTQVRRIVRWTIKQHMLSSHVGSPSEEQ
jgi:hypothetical protein